MPLGRLTFQDRAGGKSFCLFNGVTDGAALVSLATTLKGFSNAEIVEAAIREEDSFDPVGYPLTDPPFDSVSVRAKLTYKITDATYPVDEPNILTPTLYCPLSSLLEVVNGEYVLPTDEGIAIGEAIGNAIGWDLTFQHSELVGIQI